MRTRRLLPFAVLSMLAAACEMPPPTPGPDSSFDVLDVSADRADVRDVPVTTDTQDVPVTMDTQDVPVIMDTQDVPVIMDTQDVPVAMDTQDVPVTMDVQDVPPAQDVQDVPPAQDVQDTPDVPMTMCSPACAPGETCMGTMCVSPVCTLQTQSGGLTLPATLGGTTTVMGNLPMGTSRITATSCQATVPGAEHIYTLQITQPTGVIISTSNTTLDTVLSIRATNCTVTANDVACNDDFGAGSTSQVKTVLNPGTYSVIVDNFSATTSGMYNLNLTTFAPAANAMCSAPATIPATNQNTVGGTTAGTQCNSLDDGEQLFYTYTIPARTTTTFTATPAAGLTPPTRARVRVLTNCAATTCLTTAVSPSDNTPGVATFTNSTMAAQTVIVSVASWDAAFPLRFDLTASDVALPATPPNAMCSMATALANGTTLSGQNLAGATDTISTQPGCTGGAANVLYYTLTVPANNWGQVLVTPGTGFDVSIMNRASCAATMCSSTINARGTGIAEEMWLQNTTASAQTFTFAIGGATAGTFSIVGNVGAYPANATCATATTVMNGTMLTGQQTGQANSPIPAMTCGGTPTTRGNILYYTASVPVGSTLSATVVPSATLDPVIYALPMCGATACSQAGVDAGGVGGNETFTFTNTGATAATVIFGVGSFSATNQGTFALNVSVMGAPNNAMCSMATALTSGTPLTNQNSFIGTDQLNTGTGCGTTTGRVVYYTATVPAGQAGTVTVTPTGFDAVVRTLPACGTTCTTVTDVGGTGGAETVFINNTTGTSALTTTIGVSALNTAGSGTFTIALNNQAPPANRMCASPTALTINAAPITNQLPILGTDDLSARTGCGTTTGRVLYYSVTAPAGQRVLVRAVPSGMDIAMRSLTTCAGNCTASVNANGTGGTEVIVIDNSAGATPLNAIVAVGATTATASGTFAIDALLPYTVSTTTGACDTLSTPTNLAWGTTDDSATTSTPLPTGFAFNFFGVAQTHFSMTTNGFAQLATAMTTGDTTFTNVTIPSTGTPNSFIAPFWDDMIARPTSVPRYQRLTGPDRLVLEWPNMRFAGETDATGSTVTMQVKLFATTNVIEFHYCTLTAATSGSVERQTGNSATVGLEAPLGATGTLIHFSNTGTGTGPLTTGTAYRMTPN